MKGEGDEVRVKVEGEKGRIEGERGEEVRMEGEGDRGGEVGGDVGALEE